MVIIVIMADQHQPVLSLIYLNQMDMDLLLKLCTPNLVKVSVDAILGDVEQLQILTEESMVADQSKLQLILAKVETSKSHTLKTVKM